MKQQHAAFLPKGRARASSRPKGQGTVQVCGRRTIASSCLTLAAIMALMVFMVAPASASATGTAVGKGFFTHPTETPPCSNITDASYTINQVGTYSATDVGGTATYNGPSTMTVTITTDFYEGPKGTHGTDSTCADGTTGTATAATISVAGSLAGSSVSCSGGTGAYKRGVPTGASVTITDTSTSCTVIDSGGSHSQTMTQTSSGVVSPCYKNNPLAPPGPPDECVYEGTFTA